MAEANEAPAEAPKAPESVETPTNTNPEPVQAPDMHGFTSEQLADMKKFFDNNGGFDGVKAKISNPQPAEKPAEMAEKSSEKPAENTPTSPQPTPPVKPVEGAITTTEWLAKEYFKSLAQEEKYAPIAKDIADGSLLEEMASFNIHTYNPDGSFNDKLVRKYLDLKAKTVPAQPTNTEPNMSNAPTVDYITVGDKFESMDQAQAVFMQPGHPNHQDAANYIKAVLAGKDPYAKPVDKK